MNNIKGSKIKILGGLLGIVLSLTLLAGAVHAATVTVSCSPPGNPILDNNGSNLAAGAYVQIIKSTDSSASAPSQTDGLPTSPTDTVVNTGTLSAPGTFTKGGNSIPSGQYCYIVAWETWNGTGTPSGRYGISEVSPAMVGISYNFFPASFKTDQSFSSLTGTLQFSSASYSVSEAGPTVTITVTRVGGSSGAASVNYATSNGTATAGSDYTAASGTLNWSNGDSASKTFNVSIIDDSVYEGNETVNLTLSNATGASMGSPSTATLTITENDPPPATGAVQFSSATYSVSEAGPTVTITVTRVGGSSGAASVNYATSNGTATAPSDYTTTSGTLNWSNGDSASKTFNVSIIDDGDNEGNETVNLTLSNAVGAVMGSPSTATLTITDNDNGGGATITGSSPNDPYVGETITITGSGFGSSPGTITIGGVPATPTSWADGSITVAVPDGVAPGSADIVVNGSAPFSITINSGGLVIDDFEGGCVGDWVATPNSGYYAYGSGITPTNFAQDVRQAEALKHGAFGAKVMYSYDGVETYGGWGAARVGTIDVDSYASFSFYINWDGSANDIKLGFEDSAGHVYAATVSNATLQLLGGYNKVTVNKSAFSEDTDNPGRTPGAIDWTDILKYSFTYTTQGTSSNYQHIDSISAGDVDWGGGGNGGITGEVVIIDVDPPAGPAGTKFTITGSGFGSSQGQSAVVFENLSTKVNYTVDIISWSDTNIEAIVPTLAPAGNYTLKVVRITISAGNVNAYESNPATFQVTASMPPGGTAIVFPNPFNPLATSLSASGFKANEVTIAYSANGASNIGIYIYDATARLVYHETTTDTQVAWDGKDNQGNYVADGIYLLRIVNEDSKSLLAKNKILVIKKK